MNTPFNGLPQGTDRIVYVREVAVEDLPDDVEVFHVEQLAVPGLDAARCLVWIRPH